MFSKQYSFSTTQCLSEHSCYINSSNWSTTPHKRLVRWNWATFSLKNEIDQFPRLVAIFDFHFVFDIVCLRNSVEHTLDLSSVTSVRMSMVWKLKHDILNTEHRIQRHVSGVEWRHRPERDLATNDVKETFTETFGVSVHRKWFE